MIIRAVCIEDNEDICFVHAKLRKKTELEKRMREFNLWLHYMN